MWIFPNRVCCFSADDDGGDVGVAVCETVTQSVKSIVEVYDGIKIKFKIKKI